MWKITFFGLKSRAGFEEPGGTLPPRISKGTPSTGFFCYLTIFQTIPVVGWMTLAMTSIEGQLF